MDIFHAEESLYHDCALSWEKVPSDIKAPKMKTAGSANNEDPDEAAHNELPHLNLHYLPPVLEFSMLYSLKKNFFFKF